MMEFLAMGGHALYVWGSYGVSFGLLLLELFLLRRRRITQKRQLAKLARFESGRDAGGED